jgi:hypothetical protein
MSGYTKPSFFFNTLTPGQRQRISMNGSGSFLNLRNHVFSTSVSPVITSVVQTSPNTIFITGTNLSGPYPGPGTLAQWRATLGSPIASGVGTGAVCVSDIAPSSFTGTAPTTSMTAVFPNAIPPGRHDVCLTRAYLNGGGVPSAEEVIAVLQNAVPVTPYIDLDVINATAGAALLTIQTTGPSQPILLGFGEFTPTPPVVVMTNPYSVLLLNPSPSLVLSNLVSGPTGFASIGIVFSGLPAGGPAGPNSFHGAQAIDLGAAAGASPVTNAIAVRVP